MQAADFWANHQIDHNSVVRTGTFSSYNVLVPHNGGGWPGQRDGGRWYAYWDSRTNNNQFVYYGGIFHDNNGLLSWTEQQVHGVPASRAYSTSGSHLSPYVEYDTDSYNTPNPAGGRDEWRLVRNPNSGNVYISFDHYISFNYLGRF